MNVDVHGGKDVRAFFFSAEADLHEAAALGYALCTLSMTTGDLRNGSID